MGKPGIYYHLSLRQIKKQEKAKNKQMKKKNLELGITNTNKYEWNKNPILFYPTWKKWLFFGTEVKKKPAFLYNLSQRLFLWDFSEQMGFVQNPTHYSNHFLLLQRIHTMLYKSQKLFSKNDVWQHHLMLLKDTQTCLVIKKKKVMGPCVHLPLC